MSLTISSVDLPITGIPFTSNSSSPSLRTSVCVCACVRACVLGGGGGGGGGDAYQEVLTTLLCCSLTSYVLQEHLC